MELREIGTDVYACLQPDRGLGWSNSGLINRGGGVVVDTFWDLPHTRELIAQYARVSKSPAQRVVNALHRSAGEAEFSVGKSDDVELCHGCQI